MKRFFIVFLALGSLKGVCQAYEPIGISYVASKFTDTSERKTVRVVILATVKDSADFPPVINMPPLITVFENGFEKKLLLDPRNLHVSLNDSSVAERAPDVYEIVKGHLNPQTLRNSFLICYTVKDIPFTFRKMSMTVAFTEKRGDKKRVSKQLVFAVND